MFSVKEVLKAFPCPRFRRLQKETIIRMTEAFNSGVKCILLNSPTGTGKSVINTTFSRLTTSFYITPQLSLIDQICGDKYIGKYFAHIKGRQNYWCVYDPVATCDVGLCYRVRDFECEKTKVCPYWKDKLKALNANSALMSFAYFILEGYTEGKTPYSFGQRSLLIADESHSIDKYVISHVNLTVSPWSLPKRVYEIVSPYIDKFADLDEVKDFVMKVSEVASAQKYDYEMITLDGQRLTIEDAKNKNKVEDFLSKAKRFLETCDIAEWIWDLSYTQTRDGLRKKFVAEPLYARLVTEELLWKRAKYFIVSSATILDPVRFVEETGLDLVLNPDEIVHISVASTFPVENRPIVDATDGKLTYGLRNENLPWAVSLLEKIIDLEKGHNVAVHCHSYDMALAIINLINPKYKNRLITHTSRDRNEALRLWEKSRGKVFICVRFEEGYDWIGDVCRAQVLFKVPYMDTQDRRVARRLEKHEWRWYYLEAMKTIIQAYGRAVRSPTDKARFYVIDLSFLDVIKREKKYLPEWFRNALPDEWRKLVS